MHSSCFIGNFAIQVDNLTKEKENPLHSWLNYVRNDTFFIDGYPTWLKIGWISALIYLKNERKDVENIIKEVISRGGDTDTNACIVMGVIGAAVGFKGLPLSLVEKQLACDFSKGNYPNRYFYFHPAATVKLIPEFILTLKPTLVIRGHDE